MKIKYKSFQFIQVKMKINYCLYTEFFSTKKKKNFYVFDPNLYIKLKQTHMVTQLEDQISAKQKAMDKSLNIACPCPRIYTFRNKRQTSWASKMRGESGNFTQRVRATCQQSVKVFTKIKKKQSLKAYRSEEVCLSCWN